MSISRKSLKIISVGWILAGLSACAKPAPPKVGEVVQNDYFKLHVPSAGKVIFELEPKAASVAPSTKCAEEIRSPRIALRRGTEVMPMQVSCAPRLTYATFMSLDPGDYDVVLKGGKGVERSKFFVRFDVRYDNPDFNSGGDETIEKAKKINLNTEVSDSVSLTEGDATDWYSLDASAGYLVIKSTKKGEGEAEMRVFQRGKGNRANELGRFPIGQTKAVRFTSPKGGVALQVAAKSSRGKSAYSFSVFQSPVSPTKALSVADIYKDADGKITAVFSSKDLREFSTNAKLSVFRAGGKEPTEIGTCVVGAITPTVTMCVIEKPSGELGRGDYFAKPEEAKS